MGVNFGLRQKNEERSDTRKFKLVSHRYCKKNRNSGKKKSFEEIKTCLEKLSRAIAILLYMRAPITCLKSRRT